MMFSLLAGCGFLQSERVEPAPPAPSEPLKIEAPEPEEPPVPVAPKVVEIACTETERTRLACELSTGHKLALCEAGGALAFRYGRHALEMSFPETGHSKDFTIKRDARGEDGEIHTVEFMRQDYTYRMISERQEDQFDVVFEVVRGKQRLSKDECVKQGGIDFTELPKL